MIADRAMLSVLRGTLTKRNPVYVQVAVTKRCNLRCRFCSIMDSWKDQKEMSLHDLGHLASVLRDLNTGVVVLTGGEPFLRNDLPDIIRVFKKSGLNTRVQTNGVACSEEDIKDAVKAGLDEVSVSLDSLMPAKQDKVTGIPGSWNKTIDTISIFSETMPRRGSMPIINSVLSRLNIEEIKRIVIFSSRIGFYTSVIPVHLKGPIEEGLHFRTSEQSLGFGGPEFSLVDRTYNELMNMKRKGFRIYNSFRFLRESPGFIKTGLSTWRCHSPYLYFAVSPGGFFSPCIDMSTGMSLLDSGFHSKYHSRQFRKRIARKVRACPGCMYGCWPEITYLSEDFPVFLERAVEGLRIMLRKRRPASRDEIIKNIRSIT